MHSSSGVAMCPCQPLVFFMKAWSAGTRILLRDCPPINTNHRVVQEVPEQQEVAVLRLQLCPSTVRRWVPCAQPNSDPSRQQGLDLKAYCEEVDFIVLGSSIHEFCRDTGVRSPSKRTRRLLELFSPLCKPHRGSYPSASV